jgi:DNA polymerase III alpha subunit
MPAVSAPAPFVPLRIFSSYTMLDGAIEPKAIAKQAKKLGFPAAALTDRNGLYAAMAFSDACKGDGVQPIVGAMLCVARPGRPPGAAPVYDWLALYAQTMRGYDNLCALVSMAHLDRPIEEQAHVGFEALAGRTDDLLCLTAGGEGALARLYAEDQPGAAADYCAALEKLFPDRLYIERLSRSSSSWASSIQMGFPGYFLIVADFIKWAKAQDIPVGPGRGSGAGSLVAWALTITDLDPLALRPAVRALPQSRTRVDAGLRHRLLPGRGATR